MRKEEAIKLADLLTTHFERETNIRSYVCDHTSSLYIRIGAVAIKITLDDMSLLQKDIFGEVDYYPISSSNTKDTDWDHGQGD